MVQRLRRLRLLSGMTQQQLATASNVPRICIARYEAGEYAPSMKNAGKLAAALGCTIDDLIGERNEAIPDNPANG